MALRPEGALWEQEGEQLKCFVGKLEDRAKLGDLGRDAEGDPVTVAFSEDRRAELVQHLRDLGYLTDKQAQAALEPADEGLWPAHDEFLAEARAWVAAQEPDTAEPAAPPDAETDDEPPPASLADLAMALEASATGDPDAPADGPPVPSPAVLELLRQLTSLDGELSIAELPGRGAQDLSVRSIHFRLKSYGFYTFDVGNPLDERSEQAIAVFAGFLGVGDAAGKASVREAAVELAGDVRAVLRKCAEHPRLSELPLYYRDFRVSPRMQAPLNRLSVSREGFAGTLIQARLTVRRTFDEVEPLGPTENQMGLRFLQAGLWAMGFYEGRLDGIWGEMSHDALMAAIEARDLDAEQVVIPVGAHVAAVNLPYLAEHLFGVPAAAGAKEKDERELLADNAPKWLEDGHQENDEDKAEGGLWGRIVSGFRKAVCLGRRIVIGARSLLRSAVDGVRRGVNWLMRRVQALIAPVRDAIRLAYRSAREAAHTLARAIKPFVHFVLRKPIVSRDAAERPFAMSHFDLDRDVVHWASADAEPAQVARHARLCRRLARGVMLFVTVAARVVKLVIWVAEGPIGWLRIGLSVIATLAQAIRRPAAA